MVEIERELTMIGVDVAGSYAIDLGLNVLAWAGVSEAFIETVLAALRTKEIHMYPTTVLVYLSDGKALTFPIADRPPARGYREPHWCPVVLNAGPGPLSGRTTRGSNKRSNTKPGVSISGVVQDETRRLP